MNFRSAGSVGVITTFAAVFCFSVSITRANNGVFYRNLSTGMNGEDVRQLQILLNSDPDTQIVGSGAGSAGQETQYYGRLTADAVIRLQEKYRDQILTPNYLSAGTGYVGPATLRFIQGLSGVVSAEKPISNTKNSTEASITSAYNTFPTVKLASNRVNLDKLIEKVESIATKKGMDNAQIDKIRAGLIAGAATSTDLRNKFFETLNKTKISETKSDTFMGSLINSFSNFIADNFFPETARAAAGVPFGGALLYPMFCTCSMNWLLYIQPLPPTYAVVLSYEPFTQMYASYNIPITTWLLGEYYPGPGICEMFIPPMECLPIPAEGTIGPTVGSSPL